MQNSYQEQLDRHNEDLNSIWKMLAFHLLIFVILCLGLLYLLSKSERQRSQLDLLRQRLDAVASEQSIVVKRGTVE